MTKVLLAILLVLVMMGISHEINAEEYEVAPYDDLNVMCASLAYNAGYVEQGDYYKAKVEPYWTTRSIDITFVDNRTIDELSLITQRMDITLARAARMYYDLDCEGPDDE